MQKCHFDLKLQFWRDRALAEGWWPTSIWSCQYKLEVISRGSNSNLLSNQSRTATPDMLLGQIWTRNTFWTKINEFVWTYPISQIDIVCRGGKFQFAKWKWAYWVSDTCPQTGFKTSCCRNWQIWQIYDFRLSFESTFLPGWQLVIILYSRRTLLIFLALLWNISRSKLVFPRNCKTLCYF